MTLQFTPIRTTVFYPQALSSDIVTQETKDEVLIYNLKTNRAFCLNQTAKLVFNLSTGENSVDEINKLMEKQLAKPIPEEIIWLTLNRLADENLLVNGADMQAKLNGLTRREVIRRVGLTSMIALPIILSVIAPKAAQAASGIPNNAACNSNCNIGDLTPCVCSAPATCGPNATISGTVGVGVCASASVVVGSGLSGGANANVCLFTNVCILI